MKKKRQSAAQQVADCIIKYFDDQVSVLSLEENAEVIDIVGSHVDICGEAVKHDLRNRGSDEAKSDE